MTRSQQLFKPSRGNQGKGYNFIFFLKPWLWYKRGNALRYRSFHKMKKIITQLIQRALKLPKELGKHTTLRIFLNWNTGMFLRCISTRINNSPEKSENFSKSRLLTPKNISICYGSEGKASHLVTKMTTIYAALKARHRHPMNFQRSFGICFLKSGQYNRWFYLRLEMVVLVTITANTLQRRRLHLSTRRLMLWINLNIADISGQGRPRHGQLRLKAYSRVIALNVTIICNSQLLLEPWIGSSGKSVTNSHLIRGHYTGCPFNPFGGISTCDINICVLVCLCIRHIRLVYLSSVEYLSAEIN